MKKYWQLLLIVGVIVATVSIHYIQVANAKNFHITFDKISGDDKYVDSLLIEGNIDEGMTYNSVIIGKDKTTLVDNFKYQDVPLLFRDLINQNKNFMRGKGFSPSNYFEDDTKLVYVEEPNETWKLNEGDSYSYRFDLLDKIKNDRITFDIQSKLNKKVNWLTVHSITVVNNEVKLLVRHYLNNGDEEFYIVIIDLNKQQLVSESSIETVTNDEAMYTNLEIYNQYHNLGYEKYLIYSTTLYNAEHEVRNIISRQFKVVNMETNEITPLELPDGLEIDVQSGTVDNNYFVAARMTDSETWIYRYNIGQQRWLEPVTVPHPEKFVNKELNNTYGYNGKFYVLNEMEKDFVLQIFDIENGTTLYEGILSKKDAKQKYYIWANRILEQTE